MKLNKRHCFIVYFCIYFTKKSFTKHVATISLNSWVIGWTALYIQYTNTQAT